MKVYGINGIIYCDVRFTVGTVTLESSELKFPIGMNLFVHGLKDPAAANINKLTFKATDFDREKRRYILDVGQPGAPQLLSVSSRNVFPLL